MPQNLDDFKGMAPEEQESYLSTCRWCEEPYKEYLSDAPSDTIFCSAECERNHDDDEISIQIQQ